jgi:hypothetical protein
MRFGPLDNAKRSTWIILIVCLLLLAATWLLLQ